MTNDPFADDYANEAQNAQATPNGNPWDEAPSGGPAMAQTPVGGQTEGKLVVTLKGGSQHGAPWIVIHAEDASDALNQLTDKFLGQVIERTSAVSRHFHNKVGDGPSVPQQRGGGQPGKPEGATQAPNSESRYCKHGEMPWKSGTSRQGKTYAGWFCSSQDRNDQCDPQWPAKR